MIGGSETGGAGMENPCATYRRLTRRLSGAPQRAGKKQLAECRGGHAKGLLISRWERVNRAGMVRHSHAVCEGAGMENPCAI